MISEIDTSSVVDETESTKVTTESQMAECSTELMRRPETTDGRWIPAGMQECLAGVTLMNVDDDVQHVIHISSGVRVVHASHCLPGAMAGVIVMTAETNYSEFVTGLLPDTARLRS